MARINIEECWWSDPRRMHLVLKVGFQADAAAVNMWRLAQEFWARGRENIPIDTFQQLQFANELLESNLAVVRERSVYVRGSSQYLEWTAEKREQAREAGKKSADARRKKTGTAQPIRKKPERTPNDSRTLPNDAEPSDSGSGSGSGSNSGFGSEKLHASEKSPAHTGALIGKYCELWKARYGSSPPITGKDTGIAKRVAKGIGQDRLTRYLNAFFTMPDSYLIKARHPLELFESKLKEIAAFSESGEFVTRRHANHLDDMASNMILLEKVRKEQT